MADETTVTPPVDSRQQGFNPEVEQSHADTGAALGLTTPSPTPSPASTEPPRSTADVLADLEQFIRSQFGSATRFEELLAELRAGLTE